MSVRRFSTKLSLLCLTAIVLSLFTGCVPWAKGIRSIDESVTDWRDFVWGKRAFFKRYGRDASGPFMDGFLEGYHDMLQGGDGCLPVVPPRKYWSWKYQSAGGAATVNDWFDGYSGGVAAAKEDGLAEISKIPIASTYSGANNPAGILSTPGIYGGTKGKEMMPIEVQPNTTPIPDANILPKNPIIQPTIDPNQSTGVSTDSRRPNRATTAQLGVVRASANMPLPANTSVTPIPVTTMPEIVPIISGRPMSSSNPPILNQSNRVAPTYSGYQPVVGQHTTSFIRSPPIKLVFHDAKYLCHISSKQIAVFGVL